MKITNKNSVNYQRFYLNFEFFTFIVDTTKIRILTYDENQLSLRDALE